MATSKIKERTPISRRVSTLASKSDLSRFRSHQTLGSKSNLSVSGSIDHLKLSKKYEMEFIEEQEEDLLSSNPQLNRVSGLQKHQKITATEEVRYSNFDRYSTNSNRSDIGI